MFVDAAYPGWRAFIDAEPVPIHLANEAFKAVIVPPGTHEVRFVFRPWPVYVGATVSLATALVVSGCLLAAWRPGGPVRARSEAGSSSPRA